MKFIMRCRFIAVIFQAIKHVQHHINNIMCILLLTLIAQASFAATETKVSSSIKPSVVHTNAVILLYHHVADDTPKSTSISPLVFRQHMEYLQKHYTVVPLQKVVNALKSNTPLPPNSVAITFDDGYQNILINAHPILREMDFPYTIFINPGEIGKNKSQLNWAQVVSMHNEGVSFANHTIDHAHLLNNRSSMQTSKWLAQSWQNIQQAELMLEQHIGESLKYLAYPYGEFNHKLANKLKHEGYIAFAQHSGAVGPYSNFQALPRFPAAGRYANLDSLKTKLNSLAMPVVSSSLDTLYEYSPEVNNRHNLPPITLTVNSEDMLMSQARCYFSGQPIDTQTTATQITFTLSSALPIGRSRVNCTAPSIAYQGRYYWYSQPFFVANEQGEFPD